MVRLDIKDQYNEQFCSDFSTSNMFFDVWQILYKIR
jgi:hypothetical protein